jgi:DNA mismatch endonuclease (patch repair protein)
MIGQGTFVSDVLTPAERSLCMSRIRGRDTQPERVVRSLLHQMGFRYRLNRPDLPGKPDIVFPGARKVIFVHGCFWHMHRCKYGRVVPKTRADFWRIKRQGNVARDRRNIAALKKRGWTVLVVWECQTKYADRLAVKLREYLAGDKRRPV